MVELSLDGFPRHRAAASLKPDLPGADDRRAAAPTMFSAASGRGLIEARLSR